MAMIVAAVETTITAAVMETEGAGIVAEGNLKGGNLKEGTLIGEALTEGQRNAAARRKDLLVGTRLAAVKTMKGNVKGRIVMSPVWCHLHGRNIPDFPVEMAKMERTVIHKKAE